MAIGDLIPLSHQGAFRDILRFDGQLSGGESMDNFAEAALFETRARVGPEPSRWWHRLRPRWIPGTAPRAGVSRSASILRLLQTEHDILHIGTQYGIEAVGIPFSHLVLLGAFSSDIEEGVRLQIQRSIAEAIRDYVDDRTGVRVLCRTSADWDWGRLALFFGKGVFVPEPGEKPQGYVEIYGTTPGRTRDEPMLCRDFGSGLPAAFYRGQSALVFGSSPARVAATVGASLPFDEDAYFYLRPARDQATLELVRPDQSSNYANYVYTVDPLPEAEAEAAFQVDCRPRDGGGRFQFMLRCTRDARLSRLRRSPPENGGYLEIAGFFLPGGAANTRHRWWIDLDESNRLIGLAGVRRGASIVAEGRKLTLYDWNDLCFGDQTAHRLERIMIDKAERYALRSSTGSSFGYLALPETSRPVTFQRDWWKAPECYALDWLDFSGGVERAAQPGKADGLAAEAGRRTQGQRMPGWRKSDGDGWCMRSPGPDTPFNSVPDLDLEPGGEVIVGPLILRAPGG
jgi:hypothetical protein